MNLRIGSVDIEVVDDDPFYQQVVHEIENIYNLDVIRFRKGDVVLDVGAHVGLVSIYLAKRHRGITVHSYEPVPENFAKLVCHLWLNDLLGRVHPRRLAVTADGGDRVMVRGGHHSGGATAFHAYERDSFTVHSTTVPAILEEHDIGRIRLLKLDCEGAEHEILGTANGWLKRVSHIRGEIHQVSTQHSAVDAAAVVPDVEWTFA